MGICSEGDLSGVGKGVGGWGGGEGDDRYLVPRVVSLASRYELGAQWRKGRWFLCFLCLLGMSTNLFQPYSRIFTALFAIYLYENQFSLDVVTDIAKVVSMKRLEGTLCQQASDGSTGNAWIRLVSLSFYPG